VKQVKGREVERSPAFFFWRYQTASIAPHNTRIHTPAHAAITSNIADASTSATSRRPDRAFMAFIEN
jgi:hypothetical protein